MGEAAKRLLDERMALPDDQRELIAVELNMRLHAADPEWESAWADEIERRIGDLRNGTATMRTWEEVRADLRARRGR